MRLLVLTPLLIAAALCGCGRTGADVLERPEVTVRLALYDSPASKAWLASELFRRDLERRSGGRIRVMFYDSGVLGSERQLVEACYLGVIEIVQCTSSVLSTVDPAYSLLDLPYLFLTPEQHRAALAGPAGRELLDRLRDHRLQGLGFFPCGFRNIFNVKGVVIRTPADLAGMKIRVMESPVMLDSLDAMGASAVPMATGELFQALKTGVIDGAENNLQYFVSTRFFEAGAKNYSFTRHFASQHIIIANLDWLRRLEAEHPDLARIVRESATQALPEYDRGWDEAVAEAQRLAEAQGVKFNEADVAAFAARVKPVHDKFFRDHQEVPRRLADAIQGKPQ